MARPPGGGLVGRLLSGFRGRGGSDEPDSRAGGKAARDASERLDAAQQRLKDEIPPPEEPDPSAPHGGRA